MLELKNASEKDAELLQVLSRKVWELNFPGIISQNQIDYMLDKLYDEEIIKEELKASVVWKILYYKNEPIGFYSYSKINEKRCKLHKICIHPDFQRKGYGEFLVRDVISSVKAMQIKEILVNVNRYNTKAINAYTKYGFVIYDKEDMPFGDFLLNDYIMKMKL